MYIKILGSGNSRGVPVIGCKCKTCISPLEVNKRTRSSSFVSCGSTDILIDASPDLRAQVLRHGISSINAAIFSHAHFDHVGGIFDLPCLRPKHEETFISIFGEYVTMTSIVGLGSYLFVPPLSEEKGACGYLRPNLLEYYKPFNIGEIEFLPFQQDHGPIDSTGFLINKVLGYCTDVKSMPTKSMDVIMNVDTLIFSCQGLSKYRGHMNLYSTLDFIKEINPRRAILTHSGHGLEYNEISDFLKSKHDNVSLAFDGMVIDL